MSEVARVLVIKLSALGDFVLAMPAFARIRQAHPDAQITLLTTEPFEALGRSSPYFDCVETDGRPRGLSGLLRLIWRLRRAAYDRVYDLQNSGRTLLYFQLLRPFPPAWSGTASGCALPHRNPDRITMHPLERHAEQLKQAGIWPDAPTRPLSAPPPDLSWILGCEPPHESERVCLIVPGTSAHRPHKRWPAQHYAALAERLQAMGFDIVIIGGAQEGALAHEIRRRAPLARDLTGRTDFARIAGLGARAAVAVGNDTGPVHIIAAMGAPTLVLFSSASDPALSGPRGRVEVLQATDLKDLSVDRVADAALALAGRA
jgi:ADP-heptose:LPS heptosyltransferase